MSRRTDTELVDDILDAAQRVMTYVSGMSYDTFVADTKTQDAVIRNIEIIGEAAKTCPSRPAPSSRKCLGGRWQGPETA